METKEFTMRSKIKTLFSEELLKLIGSICDTKRVDSSQRKMKLLQQLLKRYEVRFDVLGGATNRLALFIDGYAVKFAMDRQGYKDNLMEYALSRELQPYVTKTYESNGYILIAEAVKTMTLDDFRLRKPDIMAVLRVLGTDYLLGDVGYIKKNFTNWGIRDNGQVVILDFAYIHRGTENLFTCDVCGSGLLVYDSTYSYLRCNNSTVCTTKYTYHERKVIQGDQVDIDMIDDAKSESVIIGPGCTTKTVMSTDGYLSNSSNQMIETVEDYKKYVKDVKYMLYDDFNANEAADLIVQRFKATKPEEVAVIDDKLKEMVGSTPEPDTRFIQSSESSVDTAIINAASDATQPGTTQVEVEPESDVSYAMGLDDITQKLKNTDTTNDSISDDIISEEANDEETGHEASSTVDETTYENPLDAMVAKLRKRNESQSFKSPFGYTVVVENSIYPTSTVIKRRS